jgi:hypothetical protein
MHPDTVICQVKISRAAMKAAQEAAKAPVKGKKNNIFQSYLKASVVKLVLLFNISSEISGLFQTLTFQKHKHCLPTDLSLIHFNLLSAKKAVKRIFITIGAILQPLYPLKTLTLYPPKFIIISLTNHLIKFTFTLCLNGYQIYFHQNNKKTILIV